MCVSDEGRLSTGWLNAVILRSRWVKVGGSVAIGSLNCSLNMMLIRGAASPPWYPTPLNFLGWYFSKTNGNGAL